MQNLTIPCLFTLLFHATCLSAQSSPQREGRATRPAPSFFQELASEALFNNPKSAPPGMKDYLLRWLNPNHAPAELSHARIPTTKRLRNALKKNLSGRFIPSQSHSFSHEVRETWVRHYASGLAASLDKVTGMTVDGVGNVYVTGHGANLSFQPDYQTIKYDAAGNQVWIARYNGVENGADLAAAICVDAAGNVYVTGSSEGLGSSYDYATIKYNSSGIEQWVACYNGSGNAEDGAIDLVVDSDGNVYVTGTSIGSNSSADYLTIKYNSSGIEQWVVRYNGLANANDDAVDLALDDSGNVYVTGTSVGSGTDEDYATIKYNFSGVQQWIARYNGPNDKNYDEVAGLAVDRSGNVYVTGTSEGLGTIEDYTTIKYNTAGEQQWIARYNGPGDYDVAAAIAIDEAGNVYVTGSSDSVAFNSDFATVKYNAAGEQQWVARYNGPGDDSEEATAVDVDESGNVYVTGKSFGAGTEWDYATIKYNSFGVRQWVVRYDAPGHKDDYPSALHLDVSGNIHVAGTSDGLDTFFDYATLKYNSVGVEQWQARYNSLGNADDRATAIALDASGNVYVTGRSMRFGTSCDYLTIKFNPSGIMQWQARYNGSGNDWDEPTAIAVDDAGYVYVTGISFGSDNYDYATVKYSPAGVEQWVGRYDGPGNADDYATALAIDPVGSEINVYVTGWSSGTGTARDYATIKYNSFGGEQWVKRYNGAANADDQAIALQVDAAGNVYVTGSSQGSGTSFDYATIKYNFAGDELWLARYDGSGNADDEAAALALDASGNVYVTGSSTGAGTFSDIATIKYNSMGTELWVKRYDDPDRPFNMATSLALDDFGNVHVTGTSWGPITAFDYTTIKYNTSGNQQWVALYNNDAANDADHAVALALDDSANVYVTGWSVGDGTFSDYATVRYNAAGTQQWVSRYNRSGPSLEYAAALVVDSPANGRNVYVVGWSEGEHWSMYTTIKYVQTPSVSVKDERTTPPGSYWLSQNYPNPVGNAGKFLGADEHQAFTRIQYALPKTSYVTLKVFNLLGEEIATLVSAVKPAGEHEVQWRPTNLPGGVYVYRLQADDPATGSGPDYVQTKRLILLR
ncbi:MAG: SBBP repeat-containing protein [candidate division KSB1 bacterium]|nr:SBBP repeat-containing protein [candidate division KSB1 bacterium]MDZ7301658.1 SBBP repeat-containing protein [candidate division KSB1 bacterium]